MRDLAAEQHDHRHSGAIVDGLWIPGNPGLDICLQTVTDGQL